VATPTTAGLRRTLLVLFLAAASPLAAQTRPSLSQDKDPNDWTAYYERGMRELDRRPLIADEYFAYAARLDPSVAEPLLGRYAAWWRSRPWLRNRFWLDKPTDNDSARRTEDWLAEADLRNPFVQQGVLLWTLPKGRVFRTEDAYPRGVRAYFRGEWQESIRELATAVSRDSTRWPAYRYRGLALAQLGQWDEAAHDFEALLSRIGALETQVTVHWDLGKARLYYTLALIRLMGGHRDEARQAFQRTFEVDLGFVLAHMYYGNMLLEDGDTVGGLREYALAAELRPDDPLVRQNYGAILLNLGRADSALIQLTEAIRLAPDYAPLYFNRAICLERLGRFDDARAMHREFVARAPRRLTELLQQSRRRLGNGAGPP
jgi:tetratricopeptide (TPR) repeat protein